MAHERMTTEGNDAWFPARIISLSEAWQPDFALWMQVCPEPDSNRHSLAAEGF